MKHSLNLKLLVIACALCVPALVLAQKPQPKAMDCNAVKIENQRLTQQVVFLKEQLNIANDNSVSITNKFTSDIDFKLLSCDGDKSSQRVTVTYRCQSKDIPHQKIRFCGTKMSNETAGYDDFGKSYSVVKASLGNSSVEDYSESTILPTDIGLVGTATLSNVLASNVDALRQLNLYFEAYNSDGGENMKKGIVGFSNVKINWR